MKRENGTTKTSLSFLLQKEKKNNSMLSHYNNRGALLLIIVSSAVDDAGSQVEAPFSIPYASGARHTAPRRGLCSTGFIIN